jgi:hypothetical protein
LKANDLQAVNRSVVPELNPVNGIGLAVLAFPNRIRKDQFQPRRYNRLRLSDRVLGFAASSKGKQGESKDADYYAGPDKERGDVVKE